MLGNHFGMLLENYIVMYSGRTSLNQKEISKTRPSIGNAKFLSPTTPLRHNLHNLDSKTERELCNN